MSESTEQQLLIQWFKLAYPKYHLISIPNGQMVGGRNKFALINKYKAEGLTPGVSDLFLCVPNNGYNGLWLEMKDRGEGVKSLSPHQKMWLSDMEYVGYKSAWAAGFDEARDIIINYLQ